MRRISDTVALSERKSLLWDSCRAGLRGRAAEVALEVDGVLPARADNCECCAVDGAFKVGWKGAAVMLEGHRGHGDGYKVAGHAGIARLTFSTTSHRSEEMLLEVGREVWQCVIG